MSVPPSDSPPSDHPTAAPVSIIESDRDPSNSLRKVLDATDPDPFRREVRAAIHRADKAGLLALAEDPQALRQPVRFAIIFGQLYYVPLAVRERVLAPAIEKSPNDLSLLIAMSNIYQNSGELRRDNVNQQLRWTQAAVAARPSANSPGGISRGLPRRVP